MATDGSWVPQTTDHDGTPIVNQHGPRRLWDGLEQAHSTWIPLGAPLRQDFGLTVAADGAHVIWHARRPSSHLAADTSVTALNWSAGGR